jgi:uncharacterized membrane protein
VEAIFSDWLNLILRWAHITTAIAWIGSSFFFNWLDSRIEAPEDDDKVEGSLWLVHGGGFYNMVKINLAPDELPAHLHWVKWEAGFAWITGFFLLVLVYYAGASAYTMPAEPTGLGIFGTIAVGLGTVIVAWVLYDLLWNSKIAAASPWLAVAISFLALIVIAWALPFVMSGRAAYLHVGVVLGTLMAANVWMRIIPSQRDMVDAMKTGGTPNKASAVQAKFRSTHNNYMTLPVLLIMVSGHYASTYGSDYSWAILAVLAISGASVRHYFNLRNKGRAGEGLWFAAAGVVLMLGLLAFWMGQAGMRSDAGGEKVAFAEAQAIVAQRCTVCHSATPDEDFVDAAPLGVMFDTPAQIQARAADIQTQTVQGDVMPPGNMTEMTAAEREVLGRWIAQGAKLD